MKFKIKIIYNVMKVYKIIINNHYQSNIIIKNSLNKIVIKIYIINFLKKIKFKINSNKIF
jgi:hypothetical protein